MKFATILREAGFSTEDFKNCAEIPIVLYDRKDRVISDDDVHYSEELFQNNPSARERFSTFLAELETNLSVSIMDVKIDEAFVIVFPHSHRCRIFSRKSITTMD